MTHCKDCKYRNAKFGCDNQKLGNFVDDCWHPENYATILAGKGDTLDLITDIVDECGGAIIIVGDDFGCIHGEPK